jgi:hypothetical protein
MNNLKVIYPKKSTSGAGTAFPSGVHEFTSGLLSLQEYLSSLPDCEYIKKV